MYAALARPSLPLSCFLHLHRANPVQSTHPPPPLPPSTPPLQSYAKAGQWSEAEDLFWALRSHIPMSSPQGRRAYHHVCEALVQARQTQGLAHFMQRNQGGHGGAS